MNALLEKYTSQNLIALGFPCNQFGLQEPGLPAEILNCYKYVRPGDNWVPQAKFHILEKLQVNGEREHPLYKYMKSVCPAVLNEIGVTSSMFWNPVKGTDITWNFGKFILDKKGRPRYRFPPSTPPSKMKKHIDVLLAE